MRNSDPYTVNQDASKRKINTLNAMRHKDSTLVDPQLHQDLVAIVGESRQALPDGSFRELLWEQQHKALQSKDPAKGDDTR